MRTYRSRKSGFTLVEILIVVIILGILAAIVIPQFTNASEDARESSVRSTLQSLRSQVELFKLQHRDQFPLGPDTGILATGDWNWNMLTAKTTEAGAVDANGEYGPYLQSPSQNSLRQSAFGMIMSATDVTPGAAVSGAAATDGFVFSRATGKIWALDKDGNVFAE